MKCKHCGKTIDNSWYKMTGGYCYNCRKNGFSRIKEMFVKSISKSFRRIMWGI